MQSMTIRFDDDLMDWLKKQAELNHRSVNRHLEHLLEQIRRDAPRYALGSTQMCHTGQHFFINPEPAMADFCNCGVFIYGEVVR